MSGFEPGKARARKRITKRIVYGIVLVKAGFSLSMERGAWMSFMEVCEDINSPILITKIKFIISSVNIIHFWTIFGFSKKPEYRFWIPVQYSINSYVERALMRVSHRYRCNIKKICWP
jgi:hypothetical protein